ncbi:helix-turn-helix domain-containing protein [Herbaspirillum frisingense]|uniref:Transcriptional regulator with XRE-family HTH domain n=1 Tax=Herbaspirillum frisingense TaxID=92645 RepID=A0ABU1PI78_9BURK|nr:helix-turn-helix domain-containing protein [Herbaspirillum frisingense]MDR6585554.1 transcriptional regulator with XRE-family HTH domain [Herbaspirillum frisingense]
MILDDEFPRRLAQTRAEKGLSQQELAQVTGIAAAQISRYESGKNVPRPGIVVKLAKALGASMTWLSTGDTPFAKESSTTDITLPTILRLQLEDVAKENGRSLSEEITARLEESFSPGAATEKKISELVSKELLRRLDKIEKERKETFDLQWKAMQAQLERLEKEIAKEKAAKFSKPHNEK